MKIEIVEFYPVQDKNYIGTMHIYMIEQKMDLRGIKVFQTKKGYFFQLPGQYGTEDGKSVFYPFISFINDSDKVSLIKQLIKKGSCFIKKMKEAVNG